MGFWRRRHDNEVDGSSRYFTLEQMLDDADATLMRSSGVENTFRDVRSTFNQHGIDLTEDRSTRDFAHWVRTVMNCYVYNTVASGKLTNDEQWMELELALMTKLKRDCDD